MDMRLLHRKDLLIDYLSSIYPADRKKFKRMSCKQLKAIILSVSRR